MTGTIRLQRVYDAPVDVLWELCATRDGLAGWLMPNDFEPVVGHRFTFTDTPRPPLYDGIVGCRVLDLDPPRLLRLAWAGGPVDTVVTFRLEPVAADRTRLELTHTGFEGLKGHLVRAVLDLGWRRLLRRGLPGRLR